jgi:imidazolonepropionase-like amidohydrolase
MPRARALLDVAGEEAKRVGLPLIVHATQLQRAKEALRAGATLLVHSVAPDSIDDEFVSLAKANGAIVNPTLTVLEGYADVAAGRSPQARYPLECVDRITRAKLERKLDFSEARTRATEQRARATFDATVRNIQRMRAAGIPMVVGTDAGNPGTAHGPSIYREMEAMQGAGMSAPEVFASATIIAARAMHRDQDLGSLEKGKKADLVVFDADPTEDIANARRVRLVMRGGTLYRKSELLSRP